MSSLKYLRDRVEQIIKNGYTKKYVISSGELSVGDPVKLVQTDTGYAVEPIAALKNNTNNYPLSFSDKGNLFYEHTLWPTYYRYDCSNSSVKLSDTQVLFMFSVYDDDHAESYCVLIVGTVDSDGSWSFGERVNVFNDYDTSYVQLLDVIGDNAVLAYVAYNEEGSLVNVRVHTVNYTTGVTVDSVEVKTSEEETAKTYDLYGAELSDNTYVLCWKDATQIGFSTTINSSTICVVSVADDGTVTAGDTYDATTDFGYEKGDYSTLYVSHFSDGQVILTGACEENDLNGATIHPCKVTLLGNYDDGSISALDSVIIRNIPDAHFVVSTINVVYPYISTSLKDGFSVVGIQSDKLELKNCNSLLFCVRHGYTDTLLAVGPMCNYSMHQMRLPDLGHWVFASDGNGRGALVSTLDANAVSGGYSIATYLDSKDGYIIAAAPALAYAPPENCSVNAIVATIIIDGRLHVFTVVYEEDEEEQEYCHIKITSSPIDDRRFFYGLVTELDTYGRIATVASLGGVSHGHSNLVPNETYYIQKDGTLGLQRTPFTAGLAISDDKILVGAGDGSVLGIVPDTAAFTSQGGQS